MRLRRRFSKKVLLLSILFLALLAGYIKYGLLPGRLQTIAIQKIEAGLNKKIYFDKLLFVPFQGLCFYNVKIADLDGRELLSAKSVGVGLDWVRLLKKKEVSVDELILDRPYHQNKWPLEWKSFFDSSFLKTGMPIDESAVLPQVPSQKFSLHHIKINGGVLLIADDKGKPIEEIDGIDLHIQIKDEATLAIQGRFQIGKPSHTSIQLKGVYDLSKSYYAFDVESQNKRIPVWLEKSVRRETIAFQSGPIKATTSIKNTGGQKISFSVKAASQEALILVESKKYKGPMALSASGVWDSATRSFPSYEGTLELIDVSAFLFSDRIKKIDNLRGKILFKPDLLEIKNLEGLLEKIKFQANATIVSFKDLNIKAIVELDSATKNFLPMAPDNLKNALNAWNIEGPCHATLSLEGSLKNTASMTMTQKITLTDNLITKKNSALTLEHVSAEIVADALGARITKSSFSHQNTLYALSLSIPKDPNTSGQIKLKSSLFKMDAAYTNHDGFIRLERALVALPGINADVYGDVPYQFPLRLNLKGAVEIDLSGATPFLAEKMEAFKIMRPRGNLKGSVALDGLWNDPLSWDLALDLKGIDVWIKEMIHFNTIDMQIRLRDKKLTFPYFHSEAYQGQVRMNGFFDLTQPDIFFNAQGDTYQVNLGELLYYLPVQFKNVSGTVNSQITLGGYLKSKASYKGGGAIDIQNGKLWDTQIFNKLGTLPFVKKEGMDQVSFDRLTSSFDIIQSRIWSQNLYLQSRTVYVGIIGSIGFDQSLDLIADPQLSTQVLEEAAQQLGQSVPIGGFVPMIVQGASGMIPKYRIIGTIRNPQFQKIARSGGGQSSSQGDQLSNLLQGLTQ